MQNRKDRRQYIIVAVLMMVLTLTMVAVPVFAAPTDNITGSTLAVNGPGNPLLGPHWGTMQMINTSGLNAYYASDGDNTCTWEFHPGNDVFNGWGFGAGSVTSGRDLVTLRKVGGNWQPVDIMVDFASGRVGINTVSPDPATRLTVYNDNQTYPNVAVYGQTAGGYTYGVGGTNSALKSRGFLGGSYSHGGDVFPIGVYGTNDDTSITAKSGSLGTPNEGVYGYNGGSGDAGYFAGDVRVTGVLYAPSKSFMIDHPLDPANKYLIHASVESPDMKNMYDGIISLDENGEAVVQLPDYFQALNKDFRYQLTCIGGAALVYVADEVADNSFKIAGGTPGLKVSWQVTGVRNDTWAQANPIQVELDKSKDKDKATATLQPTGGRQGWADWGSMPPAMSP